MSGTRKRRNRPLHKDHSQEQANASFAALLASRGLHVPDAILPLDVLQKRDSTGSVNSQDPSSSAGPSKRPRLSSSSQDDNSNPEENTRSHGPSPGSPTRRSASLSPLPPPGSPPSPPSPPPSPPGPPPSPPSPPPPPNPPPSPPPPLLPPSNNHDEAGPRQLPPKISSDFGDDELLRLGLESEIEKCRDTAQFIKLLSEATHENSGMAEEDIERLRNPQPKIEPVLDAEDDGDLTELEELVRSPHFWKCVQIFLATVGKGTSEETYTQIMDALRICYPDDPVFSVYQIRRRINLLGGVIPVRNDMCVNSCAGFVGHFKDLEQCPMCGKARYHPNTQSPVKQFLTILIGPCLQMLYMCLATAKLMHYREQETDNILKYANENNGRLRTYNDTICGKDYLEAVKRGAIQKQDILLQESSDGAQVYQDKDSDCWFAMYIIHNLPPSLRYKKRFVMPSIIVPGPKKPKNIDSFMFPSLYHVAALQREGLRYWDALEDKLITDSIPIIWMETADGPAMAATSGLVGHSGKFGCRLYCGLPGRRRHGDTHYYPALLKPLDYHEEGCLHPDVSWEDLIRFNSDTAQRYHTNLKLLLHAPNPTQYNKRRLETGIVKQTLLSGLPSRPNVPDLFVLDAMHWSAINKPDEFFALWCGTINVYSPDSRISWDWAVLKGKKWDGHGESIDQSRPFIPSPWGTPRDPAKKLHTKYKAIEKLMYLYGLAPPLLRNILPKRYWLHFCKYVAGSKLLLGWEVSPEDLIKGNQLLLEASFEFEELYIQRRPERIHFARQSAHIDDHVAKEVVRYGPPACYSQWTTENTIGNLEREHNQHKHPFMNIAERAILRVQVNTITALYPEKLPSQTQDAQLPRGSEEVGNGYALLRPLDNTSRDVMPNEKEAILSFWCDKGWPNADRWIGRVKRWGRILLPNGQKCRSVWSEKRQTKPGRRTCIVKIVDKDNHIWFGEVRYYFMLSFGQAERHALAIVSVYSQSAAEEDLYKESLGTVYRCSHSGDGGLRVFELKDIKSLVAMVPDFQVDAEGGVTVPENAWFLLEKPFLETNSRLGIVDRDDDDEDDEGS